MFLNDTVRNSSAGENEIRRASAASFSRHLELAGERRAAVLLQGALATSRASQFALVHVDVGNEFTAACTGRLNCTSNSIGRSRPGRA